ncbi:MAG: ABC transporter permease, partial [Candidatus Latescibacteria bacterium]|nr:ABC transporter permease [Candidatus Latescibacterota bacterium]
MLNLLEPIRMGVNQIRVHKLRSTLSILGILISVGSVIGIVSMGDGLRLTVTKQFDQMGGSSTIWVSPPRQRYRKGNRWVRRDWEEHLTNRDLEYFQKELENVKYIVPVISLSLNVQYRKASSNARIRASNEHYINTQNWEVEKGR